MSLEQNSPPQKTPLYQSHVDLKAKMVPFGGWLMPVSYESVLTEHRNVREHVGLFDVSHMGEIRVQGPDATKYLQYLTINDVTRLNKGAGQYSAILNEQGGMIDDLIIYKLADDEYFICMNASNRDKDFHWFQSKTSSFHVSVKNESNQWGQIAVQGPRSQELLSELLSTEDRLRLKELKYTHVDHFKIQNFSAMIARTGYTGELGYEVYLPAEQSPLLWKGLLEFSGKYSVKPIGLGARDTLRLEACYLLYGNDMDDTVSPLEAGIGWATKLDKGDFIGRSVLLKQKAETPSRQIFAFKMIQEGIPRHGMNVYKDGSCIGQITSGSVLPTLGGAGGMALLKRTVKEGDKVLVDIRGNHKEAELVKRPLYQARTK